MKSQIRNPQSAILNRKSAIGKVRVLIVDDDHLMAKTLTDIFRIKGYLSEAAYSGAEALEKIKTVETEAQDRFDCVLTDIRMPEMSGNELHRAIRAIDPELPVVFMTAYAADETIKEGLEDGAITWLTKPLNIHLVLNFLSTLRKESTIVIIDDNANFCKTLHDILEARGFNVIEITDPADVMQTLMPDGQVVLLDMKLRELSGLDVLREIRKHLPQQPVVLMTSYRQEMAEAIEACFEIGVYTCLYKPFEIEELLGVLARIRHVELAGVLGQRIRKSAEKG